MSERVRVQGLRGVEREGVVDRVEGDLVYVRLDGKTKPQPFARHRVFGMRRPAPSPGNLTRTPSYERPELRAVERETPVRSERYLAWIRQQPCAWTGRTPVEASHHPREGHGSMSAKTSDHRAIPLAPEVHREWHERGAIGGMSPAQSRAWVEEQINEHLSRYVSAIEEERGAA